MPKQSRKPKNPSVENKPKAPDNIANLGANGLLSDGEIIELVNSGKLGIDPFILDWRDDFKGDQSVKVASYGLSSTGYDVRIKNPMICTKGREALDYKDPESMKRFFAPMDVDSNGRFVVPPGAFILAESVEKLAFPRNVMGLCQSKSTYVRIATPTLCSPLESGWEGTITLEFCNHSPRPVAMYVGEGCVQVLFFKTTPCLRDYSDKGGRYQNQSGVTLAKGSAA